mmetsp:Transcript_43615/g.48868  ORF Transcript_43615/g.48868 Transcript_43615/m.48868 type:complete len:87 (-) Transcript_43615:1236-1496(-)
MNILMSICTSHEDRDRFIVAPAAAAGGTAVVNERTVVARAADGTHSPRLPGCISTFKEVFFLVHIIPTLMSYAMATICPLHACIVR